MGKASRKNKKVAVVVCDSCGQHKVLKKYAGKLLASGKRSAREFKCHKCGSFGVSCFSSEREYALSVLGMSSYKEYLRSDLWSKIRACVLERDFFKCACCGGNAHQVHHNKYTVPAMLGDDLSQLFSVCRRCHVAVEFHEDGRKLHGSSVRRRFQRMMSAS